MLTRQDILWRTLDWNLLRTFHEIAQQGGVSAAAESLNRGQPSVSQALARLEAILGVTLCNRGPSGFELTPEGATLLQISSDIIAAVRTIPASINQIAEQLSGRLRIAMMSGILHSPIENLISNFMDQHPRVEVEIAILPWKVILERVHGGDAEIGISYVQTVSADLSHVSLFEERQQLYCGARHPLNGQSFQDPKTLASYAFLLTGRDEPVELTNYRKRFELGKHVRGGSENVTELARLISMGQGLGFLPEQVGRSAEGLSPLLDRKDLPAYPVYATARPNEYCTAPTLAFWGALCESVKH